MLIQESIIQHDFQAIYGSDSVEHALELMDDQEVSTLPVTDRLAGKLVGQLSLGQLQGQPSSALIADCNPGEAVKAYLGHHIFEAARLMLQYEVSKLPIVDQEETFQGVVDEHTILESLGRQLSLTEPGSIITIRLDAHDYAISDIAHLIEMENGKILGLTVENSIGDKLHVSIKLNLENVSPVVSSLHRHEYEVTAHSGNDVFSQNLENRADELLNYLDM